jgi:CBS domain containing-hemolysin-like protein
MDPDLIVIILTLLFSALFSGVEIAFISANRLKIELDRQKGNLNSKIIGYFYEKEQRFIGTLLTGNNIALVVFGIYFAGKLNPVISAWGIQDEILLLLTQTLLSTILVLIVAEFFPKAIFQINPNGFLKTFAVFMWVLYWIMFIPTAVVMSLSFGILKILRIETKNSEKIFSKVDLEHYVQDLNERIKEEEEFGNEVQILQNALDFSRIKARDCMIPRPEIISIDVDDSIEDLSALFIKTGISKILIYRENIDNIIGYVHSFEMFKNPTAIHQVLKPINFVPEAIPGKELLEIFTSKSSNIAVVVDEYGGTSGVITIEDIIEEIFGDIEDEHDVEEWLEEKIDDSNYRFSARAEIDYINETYKLNLPESDSYETLGGLIITELESIPEVDQELTVGNYLLKVEEVSERRIEIVRLTLKDV